jgi:two-component system, OmpR family, response regulator ResD
VRDERRLVEPRVLIADAEPAVGELLALGLREHGLVTAVARDGHEALASISAWQPDLLVVDAQLGRPAGLEVVRRVRALPGARVGIVVAAGERDRLQGFAAGADDEMPKPLALDELAVRLRAIHGRRRAGSGEPEPPLVYGDLTVDTARRRVDVAGRVVDLRRREFDLLAFLARHPDRVFTREELVAEVWRAPGGGGPSTVTVHIRRLRLRLERDPSRPRWLETVRGVGYRFRP